MLTAVEKFVKKLSECNAWMWPKVQDQVDAYTVIYSARIVHLFSDRLETIATID